MLVLPLLPVPDFWITQSNYIGLYALVALGLQARFQLGQPRIPRPQQAFQTTAFFLTLLPALYALLLLRFQPGQGGLCRRQFGRQCF